MNAQLLGTLLDQHGAALALYARQWCSVPEDVVQEAFLKLFAQSSWPRDPVPWLYRVVRNGALDQAKTERRRKVREAKAGATWFAEPEVEGLSAEAAVAALQQLPHETREILVARLWGGLTFEQIGVIAGCVASSAHRRYEAGLAQLRQLLGEPCPTKSIP